MKTQDQIIQEAYIGMYESLDPLFIVDEKVGIGSEEDEIVINPKTKAKLTKEDLDNMSEDDFGSLIENFEQLDEISKTTLSSYIKKATDYRAKQEYDDENSTEPISRTEKEKLKQSWQKNGSSREQNINKAIDKFSNGDKPLAKVIKNASNNVIGHSGAIGAIDAAKANGEILSDEEKTMARSAKRGYKSGKDKLEKNLEESEVSSQVSTLLETEGLSDEFKEQAVTIFEAAVKDRVLTIQEERKLELFDKFVKSIRG